MNIEELERDGFEKWVLRTREFDRSHLERNRDGQYRVALINLRWEAWIGRANVALQRELDLRAQSKCRGITDKRCNYLAHCSGICDKCGHQHDGSIRVFLPTAG